MKSQSRFRKSRGWSVPGMRNKADGKKSGPGLLEGSAHILTIVMPARSSEMEDDLTEVSLNGFPSAADCSQSE